MLNLSLLSLRMRCCTTCTTSRKQEPVESRLPRLREPERRHVLSQPHLKLQLAHCRQNGVPGAPAAGSRAPAPLLRPAAHSVLSGTVYLDGLGLRRHAKSSGEKQGIGVAPVWKDSCRPRSCRRWRTRWGCSDQSTAQAQHTVGPTLRNEDKTNHCAGRITAQWGPDFAQ